MDLIHLRVRLVELGLIKMGWVGLGQIKWTHVHLWSSLLTTVTSNNTSTARLYGVAKIEHMLLGQSPTRRPNIGFYYALIQTVKFAVSVINSNSTQL